MRKLDISVIGVPLDYGQSRRGVDMGPSAMRYAGVMKRLEAIGHNLKDEGDVPVSAVEQKDGEITNLKNLKEVVQATSELANRVAEVVRKGNFPLVLGGDHSIAIGTIAGLVPKYTNLGVIWYDAHVDMNTAETSPSGNIHGMPLAVVMGLGHERLVNIFRDGPKVKPENIVIIGARSVDPGERELIKEKGIKVFTMHEIDRDGMTTVMKQTIAYLKARNVDGVHSIARFRWTRSALHTWSRYTGSGWHYLS